MIVILDNIRSALNVGAILRTCDAFGIKEVWFCGITPGVDNVKVQKTALGAEKGVLARTFMTTKEAILEANTLEIELVALEVTPEAVDLDKMGPKEFCALIVGNEVSGVSKEALEAAELIVQIPMEGSKESLNVGTAFGIAAYVLGRKENT